MSERKKNARSGVDANIHSGANAYTGVLIRQQLEPKQRALVEKVNIN
jgi:hypothetical protein